MTRHIAVLGAGPAGTVAALGLQRLGYRVTVISHWRRFDAIEGVSARVMQSLSAQGLHHALATPVLAAEREVIWGDAPVTRNREFLLERRTFDAGLREDLRAAGIPLLDARVRHCRLLPEGGVGLELDGAPDRIVDHVIEARGRQAPQSARGVRGPESLSLLCRWQAAPGQTASAIERDEDGWTWLARLPDGTCYWQWLTDADAPPREQLADWCARRRRRSSLARRFFSDDPGADTQVAARSSTSTRCADIGDGRLLRVGDAAMAVDPLSGNGIFQALSSGLQAPAVLHTLIQAPERQTLALRFHRERIEHLFLRFARIGRDFYRQGPSTAPFWQARQHWPDDAPLHASPDPTRIRTARRPVLKDHLISEEPVVITPDQPLGIWHLDGQPLAPLVEALASQPPERVLATLPPARRPALMAWFRSQGLVPDARAEAGR